MLASHSLMTQANSMRSRLAAVATDIHFWVPAVVLVCGLLLLTMFH